MTSFRRTTRIAGPAVAMLAAALLGPSALAAQTGEAPRPEPFRHLLEDAELQEAGSLQHTLAWSDGEAVTYALEVPLGSRLQLEAEAGVGGGTLREVELAVAAGVKTGGTVVLSLVAAGEVEREDGEGELEGQLLAPATVWLGRSLALSAAPGVLLARGERPSAAFLAGVHWLPVAGLQLFAEGGIGCGGAGSGACVAPGLAVRLPGLEEGGPRAPLCGTRR